MIILGGGVIKHHTCNANLMVWVCLSVSFSVTEPHSSVRSVSDLRTGGRWFDLRLGQYSIQGLMIFITIGFIPLLLLSILSTMVHVGKQPVAWKEYCTEYWLKKLHESMDRCTGHYDITEILLEMALNTIEPNQSIFLCLSLVLSPIPDRNIIHVLFFSDYLIY